MLADLGALLTGLALLALLYAAVAGLVAARYRGAPEGMEEGSASSAPTVCAGDPAAWSESGRNALRVAVLLLGGALAILLYALVTHRFSFAYVAGHSSRTLPLWLRLSAVWAGQEGSLLVWATMQTMLVALVWRRATEEPFANTAGATLAAIAAFYVGVTLLLSNPFLRLDSVPLDGAGLNPLLRHPGMIFHPPTLFVGYVGLAVPFAYALAHLATGRTENWAASARRWTLVAWFFLGLGLLLGARWAYDVLGWGGYWGWDPVENAGLMPWLTATALLHGAIIQRRGGGYRGWNTMLAALTYLLVVFGTFATRSGVIQSVHAFTRSNLAGVYLGFMVVVALAPVVLALRSSRRRSTQSATMPVESPSVWGGWHEGVYLLTLTLFLTLTGSILVGSLMPTVTEWLGGPRFEAGPDWFDRVTGPQFAALVLAMGVCPLVGRAALASRAALAGRATAGVASRRVQALAAVGAALGLPLVLYSAGYRDAGSLVGLGFAGLAAGTVLVEFVSGAARLRRQAGLAPLNALWALFGRNRRRYGGYLVHLGVVFMAVGAIGTRMYTQEGSVRLVQGEPQRVAGYTLVYEGLTEDAAPDHAIDRVTVTVYREGAYESGQALISLQPEVHYYMGGQTVSIPAVHALWQEDLYLILAGLAQDGSMATVRLVLNRLVVYLWIGGLLLLAGGAVAAWPPTMALEGVTASERRQVLGRRRVMDTSGAVLGVAVLAVAVYALWGPGHGARSLGQTRPPLSGEAPAFRVTLVDGTRVSLSDWRGQTVVLNFWATWCPTCTESLPHLEALWQAEQGEGLVVLGIAYADDARAVQATIERLGITFPVAVEAGRGGPARAYGITGVPETFVIDPEGRVTFVRIGQVSAQELLAEVARARQGAP